MSRFMPRKAKQTSVPLPDSVTSVIQEIKGVKRKVTPAAKKPKFFATPQFGKATNIDVDSSNTKVANDLAATNVLSEPKIKTDGVEQPSANVRIIAKPKQLSLDPMELQSITNLQKWSPSIRNPVNEGKTEYKITKTCTSQKESSDDSKSVLPTLKLTQYKSVVWNPPLRRIIPATETSATPAKRAKICETDKPDLNAEDKSKGLLENPMECEKLKTQNQFEGHTVACNAPKPTNTNIQLQVENPQSLNEQKETSQQLAKSYVKISSPGDLETNDNSISYSPMEVDENQSEKKLMGDSMTVYSQNSEEDMFLSQEPSEENLVAQNQNQDLSKKISASKEEVIQRENLDPDQNVVNVKPNSSGDIFCKQVKPSQESLEKDMFEADNQSEDPFDENWITEVAKLKTASQRSSGEGVFVEKIKNNKEDTEEDLFHSSKKITPLINLDTVSCESQRSKPGFILPPIDRVDFDVESNVVESTPPRQIELDIFSCQTIKRVLPEIPKEVRVASDAIAIDEAREKEIQPGSISNEESVIAKMIPPDECVITSPVHGTSNLKHVTEAMELTNEVSEADLYVSKCALQEDQHAKSQPFTNISDDKNLVDLVIQNKPENISENSVVQEDKSKAVLIAEKNDSEAEEQLQLNVDNNTTNDFSKNNDSIDVDRIDLPKEVDISRVNEKRTIEFEELIKPNNFPQNVILQDEINSEIQGPHLIGEHKIPSEAEIASPKLDANEKLVLNNICIGKENLLQKENSGSHKNSEIHDLQKNCKDKISQAEEKESKKSIANDKVLPTEIDSSRRNDKGDDKKTDRMEERNQLKPYTYEMEQDLDISQSQLIEIESAIMLESRQPGPAGRSVSAEGVPRMPGGFPRVAETAPGVASGKCGEARTPGFSMPNLPPMPTLNWKKKVQDDRQKLRAVIHEISRLNAMLMSVRREVWPVAGVNPDAPPLSDINRQGPGPSGRRY